MTSVECLSLIGHIDLFSAIREEKRRDWIGYRYRSIAEEEEEDKEPIEFNSDSFCSLILLDDTIGSKLIRLFFFRTNDNEKTKKREDSSSSYVNANNFRRRHLFNYSRGRKKNFIHVESRKNSSIF